MHDEPEWLGPEGTLHAERTAGIVRASGQSRVIAGKPTRPKSPIGRRAASTGEDPPRP